MEWHAGKPPAGFPKWPYAQIHLRENVIVNNIQLQIDQLHRETLRQIYVPPQPAAVEQMDEVMEDQYGQPDNATDEGPRAGSSSSESD